jgi:Bacterial regulatory protein, Fis family
MEALAKLPVHDSVAEWEKFRISQALKESDRNKAEAARRLGVHRRLLYEKIRKLGLDANDQILEDENLDSCKALGCVRYLLTAPPILQVCGRMAYSAFAFSGLGFGFVTLSCAASGRQQAASRHSRNERSFATVVLYRNFFLTSKTPSLCAVIWPTPPPTAS